MRFHYLTQKAIKAYKEGGFTTLINRTLLYLKAEAQVYYLNLKTCKQKIPTGHILIINGCSALHPARYRVSHQYEQFKIAGANCGLVYYLDVTDNLAERFDIFYIFRCMYTENIKNFVRKAKSLNKTLIYDIDDLVIDPKYTDKLRFVQNFPASRKKEWDKNELLMRDLMLECDAVISPTNKLNEHLSTIMKCSYVWRNKASQYMVTKSNEAYERYFKADDIVRIGYFSGSLTHNADFDIIKGAILRCLENYDNVHLLLVGDISEIEELLKYKNKIEIKKSVRWQKLPKILVQADINLAPLEMSQFNECKSEIKWIEAALVRVPTIASNIGAFKDMINDNETGVLCENTEEAWYQAISKLVECKELREDISKNAYNYVINHCITESEAGEYLQLIDSIDQNIKEE